jgi:hypothetical protein
VADIVIDPCRGSVRGSRREPPGSEAAVDDAAVRRRVQVGEHHRLVTRLVAAPRLGDRLAEPGEPIEIIGVVDLDHGECPGDL